MNFGDSSHKTVEMPDCFLSLGPKMAHPSWNRVKRKSLKSKILPYLDFMSASSDEFTGSHIVALEIKERLKHIHQTQVNLFTFKCMHVTY